MAKMHVEYTDKANLESVIASVDSNTYRFTDHQHDGQGSCVATFTEIVPANPNKTTVTADGVDTVIISNIPGDTFMTINDEDEEWNITDGQIELDFDYAGEYILRFENRNTHEYVPRELIINAEN